MSSDRNPLLVADIVSHVLLPMLDNVSVIVLGFTSSIHRGLCRPRMLQLHRSRRKVKEIINELYKSSPLALLRWFSEHLRYPIFSEVMSDDWLGQICYAAQGCNWELIRHFIPPDKHFRPHPCSFHIVTGAAASGSVELLRYLRSHGIPWDDSVYWRAAEHGHLPVLQYALENNCPVSQINRAIAAAAYCNHFHIVKWLHTKGFPLVDSATGAARVNNFEMLQWIVAHGGVLSSQVACEAAANSNVSMLKWLIANGCPLDWECAQNACYSGSIECLQILRDAGCPCNERSLHGVLSRDRADVLVWALQHGCPCDGSLVIAAVRRCALKVLDVLFDRSVRVSPEELWREAMLSGSVKVLRYLRDERNMPGLDCTAVVTSAALHGHLEMLQWAFEQKGSDRVKLNASRIHDLDVMEWLRENHPLTICESKRKSQSDELDGEESSEECEEKPAKALRKKKKNTK